MVGSHPEVQSLRVYLHDPLEQELQVVQNHEATQKIKGRAAYPDQKAEKTDGGTAQGAGYPDQGQVAETLQEDTSIDQSQETIDLEEDIAGLIAETRINPRSRSWAFSNDNIVNTKLVSNKFLLKTESYTEVLDLCFFTQRQWNPMR